MRPMGDRITVLLPIDAHEPGARARELSPRVADPAGATFGVVDNGLWRTMRAIVSAVERALTARGARPLERTPFDHLSPAFADQRRALVPFGAKVAGAIAGLGN